MTQVTKTHNQIKTTNTAIENLKCKECGEEYPLEAKHICCLLYTSPSPRDPVSSRMPSSA